MVICYVCKLKYVPFFKTVSPIEEHRAIRLLRIDPQLDGEYACVIISDGVQVRQAKRMVVFSKYKVSK